MTTKRTGRLALIVGAALAGSLLASGQAAALPPGSAKIGMICTPKSASGAYDLVANAGDITTPDGNSVFMWSYSVDRTAPGSPQTFPVFQSPGPVLCATEGDTVTINLRNTLSSPVSIVFPGQDTQVVATGGSPGLFATEAAASGGTVSYSFTASAPGTYLYESGTDVARQVEMGLYGALVVRPAVATQAYDDPSTGFSANREFIVLLSEVDPDLHHAVEVGGAYDFTLKHNRYFMINSRAFPDTLQDNGSSLLPNQPYGALVRIMPNDATNTQPALVRTLNAGVDNHPFHPHGNHMLEIAQDGRLLEGTGGSASTERFAESIGSGQTRDYLLRWDTSGNDSSGAAFDDYWNPTTNPLPVAQPNYRNLTFKDGNTWYSGSPYLGYKGTLPAGTNSLNVCGEWFFPWHSHALNEFANFDEPFGGMATLLRVDPTGGCIAAPSSTKISAGTLNGGSVSALAADDGTYYKVSSTTTGTRTTDWYGQFSGITAGATGLKVSYTGNNTFAPMTQAFGTLATAGTSGTLPAGWALSETGTGANTTYAADAGANATGNTYSYGTGSASERALGTLRAGTFASTIGAAFTNTTGNPISSLSLSYTGELWRYGGGTGTPDRLDFQVSTNATSLTTGTWADVDALDFTSMGTGGAGSRNGNQAANRTVKTGTVTGLSIPAGATYWIRWTDFDRPTTADDGLAVDDVSLTAGEATTTASIWNWAGAGSWVPFAGPTQVGLADVAVATDVAVPSYIGTGANKGLVRIRILSTAGPTGTTSFVTGGDFMKLVYTAP